MVKMKKRPIVNILLATFFLYSFLVSIKLLEKGIKTLGVEYILGWLPKGTHDWSKFITPDELKILFSSNGSKTFS